MSATLGNGNITFGDGTAQSTVASMLGMGQAYSDVTSSRAKSTTYTNSTGKPIFVSVNWSSPIGGQAYLYVNSILASHVEQDRYARFQVCGIVPNGSTYSVSSDGGAFAYWLELR